MAATKTLPAVQGGMKIVRTIKLQPAAAALSHSATIPFEAIQHLLSDKPIRRPARVRLSNIEKPMS